DHELLAALDVEAVVRLVEDERVALLRGDVADGLLHGLVERLLAVGELPLDRVRAPLEVDVGVDLRALEVALLVASGRVRLRDELERARQRAEAVVLGLRPPLQLLAARAVLLLERQALRRG